MQQPGHPAHHRDRHPAHRVRRQVPDRDVARLPGEVPLLLGDLRHGPLPLAPDRLHPRRRSSARGRSPTSSASSPPRWATTRRSSGSSRGANGSGFRTSVSSIRIPAVTEGVLDALHASGDRSITLAPETGTDELRVKMGKPIPNAFLLEKIRLIFQRGFTQLKLYFIIGLPEETDGRRRRHPRARSARRARSCSRSGARAASSATSTSASTSWCPSPTPPGSASRSRTSAACGEDRVPQEGCRAHAQRLARPDVAPPGDLADLHLRAGADAADAHRGRRPRRAPLGRSCAASPTASTPRSSASGRAICAGTSCARADRALPSERTVRPGR